VHVLVLAEVPQCDGVERVDVSLQSEQLVYGAESTWRHTAVCSSNTRTSPSSLYTHPASDTYDLQISTAKVTPFSSVQFSSVRQD